MGGVADPVFHGQEWSIPMCVTGCLCFLCSCFVMLAIKLQGKELPNHEESSFRAGGAPFVPGTAIILNFALMATIPWFDHLCFFILVAACVVVYFACKVSHATRSTKVAGKDPQPAPESELEL